MAEVRSAWINGLLRIIIQNDLLVRQKRNQIGREEEYESYIDK